MAAEQVNDPNLLGGQRDAFPGEVVPPEQQTTLQRLMQEGENQFRALYDEVAESGQLTPEELNAILKAGKIKAERERQKYLEGIRQNPANIIQGFLKEFKPEENNIAMALLNGLNDKVETLERNITSIKTSNQLRGENKTTLAYMKELTQGGSRLNELFRLDFYQDYLSVNFATNDAGRPQTDKNREQIVFEIIKKLGLVPADSLRSFDNLYRAVNNSGNTPESGKPYVEESGTTGNIILKVKNLSSNRPGLEGITASIDINSRGLSSVIISSSPEALARIIDRGKYVPYQQLIEQSKQQPEEVVAERDLSEVNSQKQPSRVRRIPKLPFLNRNK